MRECAQNFTYDGSFLAGRTFKTHAHIQNVTQKIAVGRAARHMANDGWTITSIDESLGIISASQTVSYGRGKTVPWNVGIETKDTGLKISMTISISGGLSTPVEGVRDSFCKMVEDIEGQ